MKRELIALAGKIEESKVMASREILAEMIRQEGELSDRLADVKSVIRGLETGNLDTREAIVVYADATQALAQEVINTKMSFLSTKYSVEKDNLGKLKEFIASL